MHPLIPPGSLGLVHNRYNYALRILRSHGLPPKALHEVARSTTLSRLMYAAPAWWGLASAADRERVDRFIPRTIRMGYLYHPTPLMLQPWLPTGRTVCQLPSPPAQTMFSGQSFPH